MQEAYKNLSLEDIDGEVWRDAIGEFSGYYVVSSLGRIKSLNRISPSNGATRLIKGRVIKQRFDSRKFYLLATLCTPPRVVRHVLVHRVVALTFIENPNNKKTVNHKNGIKTDNRVENLEWATQSENNQHGWDSGLFSRTKKNHVQRGLNHSFAKFKAEDVLEIRRLRHMDGLPYSTIGKMYAVDKMVVYQIATGMTYRDVPMPEGMNFKVGFNKPKLRLTHDQVKDIRVKYKQGMIAAKIALLYGVSDSCIHKIITGKSHKLY